MNVVGIFGILVGILMIAQWTLSLATKQVPEIHTEPIRIRLHLTAEFVTAAVLIVSGIGLLTGGAYGRPLYLVAAGMLIYTVIQSPGYFAEKRQWPLVGMFVVLFILAVASLAAVWLYQG
jgi:hypothetical protein